MGKIAIILSRFRRSPWTFFLCLSIIKLWLISHLPIRASYAGYDNLRYVVLASNFLEPTVAYDAFTLVRQPGYPAFIFLSYLLGIPLRFSQEIVYLAAGFLLAWSGSKFYFNKLAIFIFSTLYILAPFSFHWNRQTLADVLYLPLTASIVSCLIHIINGKNDRSLLCWSAGLGMGLAWFWNTRLEGIWIVLTIGLAYGIFALKNGCFKIRRGRVSIELKQIIIISSLIFLPVFLTTSGISLLNYYRYGLFDTNDLKSSGFEEAYSSLEKVVSKTKQPMVEISRSTRQQVYAVSPSFRQLKSYIENDNHWQTSSCQSGVCNDYVTGLFYWVFRESVAQAGYYKSAPQTEEFYYQISREVNAACQSEALNCEKDKLLAFLPDSNPQYIQKFFQSFGKLSQSLINSSLILKLDSGEEDKALRSQYYAKITREPANFIAFRIRVINIWKDRFIRLMSEMYKRGFIILLGISTFGFTLEAIFLIQTKCKDRMRSIAVLSLILSCILVRIVLIAYIDVTSWPVDAGDRYLRPVLPMLWLMICLGIVYFKNHFDRLKIEKFLY